MSGICLLLLSFLLWSKPPSSLPCIPAGCLLSPLPVSIAAPDLNRGNQRELFKICQITSLLYSGPCHSSISLGLKVKALTRRSKILGVLALFVSALISYFSLLCSFCSWTSQRWTFTLTVPTALNALPPDIHVCPLMEQTPVTTPFKIVTHIQPGYSPLLRFPFPFHPEHTSFPAQCMIYLSWLLCMDYLLPLEDKLHEGRNVSFARWYISWR